jgi:hypothetical protein
MYQPFIFKLDSGSSDVLDKDTKENLILSSTINVPLISLGFHYFLHRTKSAMSITKNLQTKNKFYYVVNPFEQTISNYEDSLTNLTKHYLNIKTDAPEISSRSFYKLWEMLFLFNLADGKELTIASFAKSSNAFIQAIINYRQKLGNGVDNDKFFNVNIHNEKGKYIEKGQELLGYYNNIVPNLITQHGGKNINQIKTISQFKKDIDKSKQFADLITADGNYDWEDDNYQEQEGYQLILGEIIAALRVQNKDGNFVLKLFETFTIPSIKMIYLLSSFYKETYIYKPYTSRQSNSEKYVICKGFHYDQKKDVQLLNTKIKTLERVLEEMNSNKFVFDIFPDLVLPLNYLDKFKFINIKIANPQQIMINQIITYIKENNYFGDKYHLYRDKQIEATKWWVNNFYPPSKNLYEKNKEDMQKLLKVTQEKLDIEQQKFGSQIIR